MINASNNTPASNRKKYMDVFGGKSNQKNSQGSAPSEEIKQETKVERPVEKPKASFMPSSVNEKVADNNVKEKINNTNSIKKSKKIFGLDAKSVVAVVSISLFFVFSMAGVLISLQQRMNPDQVAVPTAPKSQPAAAEVIETPDSGSCSLAFSIIEPSPSPSVSPSVSPSPSPSVSPTPSPTPSVSPSPSPTPSPTPSVSPSPSPTTYDCNSDCENNEQCESANADYICSSTYDDKCRLDSYPESEICEPQEDEYACNSECENNEQCETASSDYICYQNNCRLDSNPSAENCQPPSYEPPVIGCNDACVTNADCDNTEHICYNDACRLAVNPTSSTCSIAQTTTTYQPTKGQPALPVELPQSGSNAILDWFKAGIGVMGIGAVLLLLL
jgi:hypothetical protein